MSEMSFSLPIPLDEDAFIEMECDYCKQRFMLHNEVFQNEENIHFFCPVCGLPNKTNTFLTSEVIEMAQTIVANYMMEEIEKQLGSAMRKINRSSGGFLKMSIKKTQNEPIPELFIPIHSYQKRKMRCCGIDVKVSSFDDVVGIYCPICGGAYL